MAINLQPGAIALVYSPGQTWDLDIYLLDAFDAPFEIGMRKVTAVIESNGTVLETMTAGSGLTIANNNIKLVKDVTTLTVAGSTASYNPMFDNIPVGQFKITLLWENAGKDQPLIIFLVDVNTDVQEREAGMSSGPLKIEAKLGVNISLRLMEIPDTIITNSIGYDKLESFSEINSSVYAYALADPEGKVGLGLTQNAELDAKTVTARLASAIANIIYPEISSLSANLTKSLVRDDLKLQEIQDSVYAYALADLGGKVGLGLTQNAELDAKTVTARLASAIANIIYPEISSLSANLTKSLVREDLGLQELQDSVYAYALADSGGKVGLGLTQNAELDAKTVTARLASAIANIIYPEISTLSANLTKSLVREDLGLQEIQDSVYAYALADSGGKVGLGLTQNAELDAKTVTARLATAIANIIKPLYKEELGISEIESPFYLYALADINGKIGLALDLDGYAIFKNKQLEASSAFVSAMSKQIICFGDSLTAGAGGAGTTYVTTLNSLVTPFGYSAINCGVGGEDSATITARLGVTTPIITSPFTLPSDLSEVEISSATNYRLVTAKTLAPIKPLIQGGSTTVNPCTIADIQCTLRYDPTTQKWFLKRNEAGNARDISANTPLFFAGAKKYKRSRIFCFWMGQNGGGMTDEQIVEYIQNAINFISPYSDYLVLGLHTGTPTSRANLETLSYKNFGEKYINLRHYISQYALEDLGITPTNDDIIAKANGTFPPSFWSGPTDSTHGNANFYTAVGTVVFKRIQELNYLF